MPYGILQENSVTQYPLISSRKTNLEGGLFSPFRHHTEDVGYVTKKTMRSVFVWDGRTNGDLTLTSITGNDDATGISWDADLPEVIISGTSLRINISILATDGPLTYAAVLNFITSCVNNPSLEINGTRAPYLSTDIGYLIYPHNWENGLDEIMSWKTDVMISFDRTEQRVQLRTTPRRYWDLKLLVEGAGRKKLETWMAMRKSRLLFVPIWRDATIIETKVNAGESIVPISNLDSGSDNYKTNTNMVIFDSWDNFEVRQVSGVGSNYISLNAPLTNDWDVGSIVAPARNCLSLETRKATRCTDDISEYSLRVMANEDVWVPAVTVFDKYNGVDICPFVPSFEDVDASFDNKWVNLDNDTGVIQFDVQSEEPIFSRDVKFVVFGRENINSFLDFIYARAGRLAPFWIRSPEKAFELDGASTAESNFLIIQPINYEFSLSGCDARSHVELETKDGVIIRRNITGIETLSSGDEKLTLNDVIGVDITKSSVVRCNWFELARFNSDDITVHWITNNCIEATIPIVVLP